MYSYGPPNMAKQKQKDQLEHTYSNYVRIQDVALKTCQKRWMIGRSGKRGSGISVLAARHDDDDDNDIVYNSHVTCSNSSFSLTMVMPTSHFFAFDWLCCLLSIGYLPKPGSVGVRICHNHLIQPRPPFRWFPISSTGCTCFQHNNCGHGNISAITLLILSLSGCNPVNILWYTAPVDMMTFRWSHRSYQSICQQHPPYSHP